MSPARDSPVPPLVAALLAGAGAITWMLWKNGLGMFSHWFFYPSLAFLGLGSLSLAVGLGTKFSRTIWTLCMWWSGIWTFMFLLAFVLPPFSTFLVASLVSPIIEVGKIDPFVAGSLHFLIWACAREILKPTSPAITSG